ncbi:fatty acid desaturase [Mycolicibacterium sp. BiH015]|uniref:acyl-CoA desaturase n=1 Tax=Mycolicibacterium sp. BiH015 TaxID=3018808 RepID=UPI0022E37189|nr:fatty acid desaturase [Mycolicibacterium sp. BiH015]MDA2890611.1 fatty acid desaturase [Mycolicibacterium sp. BiH015]
MSQETTADSGTAVPQQDLDVVAIRLAYLTVGLPILGTIGAVVYSIYFGLTVTDIALFVVMYVITTIGVEGGMHRYFTHRSFEASEPVKIFLAVAGSMAAQGPVLFWVAIHRLHHAYSDTERDPHSPRPRGPGWWGIAKGLWYGHIGWLFDVKKAEWNKHTRDLLADRTIMKINAWYFVIVLIGIVLPGLIGAALTQSVHGFVGGVLWGGFARIFAVDQATWVVNSLGHTIGSRPFPSGGESTNIGVLAPPTLGGSWHNNHHARPVLAMTRRHWWQLDLVGEFIRLLDVVGLVRNVRYASAGRNADSKPDHGGAVA